MGARQKQIVDDSVPWINFLWAFENSHPEKAVEALRFEPVCGTLLISGLSAGNARSMPLRWGKRRKAFLRFPAELSFDPGLDEHSLLDKIQVDLGQLITASPRLDYPTEAWEKTRQNLEPGTTLNEVLVEYTAHEDAAFHFVNGTRIAVRELDPGTAQNGFVLQAVAPADRLVILRVIEAGTNKVVPVKRQASHPLFGLDHVIVMVAVGLWGR
ncbi:HupE/UreJ family protein [Mesorhizobium sp.]|uniref:HupE/UreJ family protein n=1 Tax=Mesorhizobium sp. TaxID=1871066 RepID=UPI0026A68D70